MDSKHKDSCNRIMWIMWTIWGWTSLCLIWSSKDIEFSLRKCFKSIRLLSLRGQSKEDKLFSNDYLYFICPNFENISLPKWFYLSKK
jgi:hypothetical protein